MAEEPKYTSPEQKLLHKIHKETVSAHENFDYALQELGVGTMFALFGYSSYSPFPEKYREAVKIAGTLDMILGQLIFFFILLQKAKFLIAMAFCWRKIGLVLV